MASTASSSAVFLPSMDFLSFEKKGHSITTSQITETPHAGKRFTLQSSRLWRRACALPQRKCELCNPCDWDSRALQLRGPHNGERWFKASVSAFPSMAWLAVSKAQEATCFLAVRGWGVWVEKNVKVLIKQLLREAASVDLVKYLSRV